MHDAMPYRMAKEINSSVAVCPIVPHKVHAEPPLLRFRYEVLPLSVFSLPYLVFSWLRPSGFLESVVTAQRICRVAAQCVFIGNSLLEKSRSVRQF
jgi:hypothetical protein